MSDYSNRYLYDEINYLYCGIYNSLLPHPYITNVAPPPPDSRFDIKWFPSSNEWFYVEKRLEPNQTENPFDKVMSYVDLRKMHYPSEKEYLDAIVKNDSNQLYAYTSNCLCVKERFPKDMIPITLREFYLQEGIIKRWSIV